MSNEALAVNNSINTEQDRERENLERQKRKLVGFYLSAGDENYIFKSNTPNFSDADITPEAEAGVVEMMANGKDFSNEERTLLKNIAGPDYYKGNNGVFGDMAGDLHQKRILTYMTKGPQAWNRYDESSGRDVGKFLERYPTPMDFDEASDYFVKMIRESNDRSGGPAWGQQKEMEYGIAMEDFKKNVYGKKYEYYKAMKEIHAEADKRREEMSTPYTPDEKKVIRNFEIFNREKLVKDSGAVTYNKGFLVGDENRQNEDATYYNPGEGLFAVFDGAGGVQGGARASNMAVEVMNQMVARKNPESVDELKGILSVANETMKYDPEAGISTAVIGKILDKGGQKSLLYASVGDSRIYLVKPGQTAKQITEDEGEGHQITNALGHDIFRVDQVGEVPLSDGDRLVFCSDGITGDYGNDLMSNDELSYLVQSADTADAAARSLVSHARKKDDRTAIVIEV